MIQQGPCLQAAFAQHWPEIPVSPAAAASSSSAAAAAATGSNPMVARLHTLSHPAWLIFGGCLCGPVFWRR